MLLTTFSTPSMCLTTFSASDLSVGARPGRTRSRCHRVDLVGEVVEYAVVRKHHEFMTDFLDDAFIALLRQ